jgi:hypothetical protein
MKLKWYAHLPNVELTEAGGIAVGMGRLVNLPFAEWSQLDPAFPYAETNYGRSRPVFYTGAAELPDNEGMSRDKVRDWVSRLHRALLLQPHAPLLPSPLMSVTYIEAESVNLPGAVVWERMIGPIEREWIVYGSEITCPVGQQQLPRIQRAYQALEGFEPGRAFAGVDAGLHILEVTTRPEFWSAQRSLKRITEFVHCIAALEHILLPARKDAPADLVLTKTFGEYGAVLITKSRDDLDQTAEILSELYRLRSELMHGGLGISDLGEENWQRLEVGRKLLASVILRALVLRRTGSKEEELAQLLAEATKNDDVHQSLHERFEGRKDR